MRPITASMASNGVSSTERTYVQFHGKAAFPYGRHLDGVDGDFLSAVHGRTGRRGEGRRPAHHDRAAARLVRLRRRVSTASRRNIRRSPSTSSIPTPARATKSRRSRPTRTTRARRRRTSSTSVSRSARQAKADGLIQPYKVATWDSIPDSAKDADGHWYGDYYGVLSFGVNKDVVKQRATGLGRPAEAGI